MMAKCQNMEREYIRKRNFSNLSQMCQKSIQ